jgi:hypothetical protein
MKITLACFIMLLNIISPFGDIRAVNAWYYEDEFPTVEDEQGQLWYVEEDVKENDNVILVIADNNTPNDFTDDIILKVLF